MTGNQNDDYLSTASNEKIFQEAAKRLKQLYFQLSGNFIENMSFEFIFDDGRFLGIDLCKQEVLYRGPCWPRLV
jgi:hypothetical protein